MRIKIYKDEGSNLSSIHFNNIANESPIFIRLINVINVNSTGVVYFYFDRPNYLVPEFTIWKLKNIISVNDLELGVEKSKINFNVESQFLKNDIIAIAHELFCCYEHSSICFFYELKYASFIKDKTWQKIVEKYKSIVLFKSFEENVIWIGKSSEINFSFLDGIF